jgi:hypothetical protein
MKGDRPLANPVLAVFRPRVADWFGLYVLSWRLSDSMAHVPVPGFTARRDARWAPRGGAVEYIICRNWRIPAPRESRPTMARKTKVRQTIEPEDESQEAQEPEAEEPETPREAAAGRPAMSKVDAVRAALAEGVESPEEGTEFIRKRFGIEIGRQHFSATKSQLKKREGGGAPKGKGVDERKAGARPSSPTGSRRTDIDRRSARPAGRTRVGQATRRPVRRGQGKADGRSAGRVRATVRVGSNLRAR